MGEVSGSTPEDTGEHLEETLGGGEGEEVFFFLSGLVRVLTLRGGFNFTLHCG